MKKRNLILSVITICFLSGFLLSGCKEQKQIDSYSIKNIEIDEETSLEESSGSPTCKININFSYLAEKRPTDSIVRCINTIIQRKILGKEYVNLASETAVDSFKNMYVHNYTNSINEFYQEDIKKGTPKDELPSWYNYTYSLVTNFSEGKEGILNYVANISEYTGGAHPNSWATWLNFDKSTGKQLTLKDVFMQGADKPICHMLLKKLIIKMASQMDDDNITSVKDLQEMGILNSTDMYLSENFLLEKEEVSFMYNRYDIAPYAIGEIILSLPYTEIKNYMMINN